MKLDCAGEQEVRYCYSHSSSMWQDSDRSGSIDHRELTKGLEWLGLRKARTVQ